MKTITENESSKEQPKANEREENEREKKKLKGQGSQEGKSEVKDESIPTKIRKNLNLIVDTHPDTKHTIPKEEVEKVHDLVEK